jgi:hypothetical protein
MENSKDVNFFDLLNPNVKRSTKEIAESRFNVCVGCDKFLPKSERCKICKCFMRLKTTLEDATCPEGKW